MFSDPREAKEYYRRMSAYSEQDEEYFEEEISPETQESWPYYRDDGMYTSTPSRRRRGHLFSPYDAPQGRERFRGMGAPRQRGRSAPQKRGRPPRSVHAETLAEEPEAGFETANLSPLVDTVGSPSPNLREELSECFNNTSYNLLEAGKIYFRNLQEDGTEATLKGFVSDNHSRMETLHYSGIKEEFKKCKKPTDQLFVLSSMVFGGVIGEMVQSAKTEAVRKIAFTALSTTKVSYEIFTSRSVENSKFSFLGEGPFTNWTLTTKGWPAVGEPHVQLNTLFRHNLKKSCKQPGVIRQYTHKRSEGGPLKPLPQKVVEQLIGFACEVFSVDRPEWIEEEEKYYNTPYFLNLGKDHATRLKQFKHMRELRHKFVSEEIPKQITNALNELRRAKFENDMWIMSKKKSVREDGLDDEDKENHAIATPQKVSKEKDQCDDVILNSVKDAAISENCLKTAEATANEISAEVTTVEPEKAA